MDEQTGNRFSVKNQLLHSNLHFKIWEGGRGHMHLPLGAQTPRTTQKHQESHLFLAANFSRM